MVTVGSVSAPLVPTSTAFVPVFSSLGIGAFDKETVTFNFPNVYFIRIPAGRFKAWSLGQCAGRGFLDTIQRSKPFRCLVTSPLDTTDDCGGHQQIIARFHFFVLLSVDCCFCRNSFISLTESFGAGYAPSLYCFQSIPRSSICLHSIMEKGIVPGA